LPSNTDRPVAEQPVPSSLRMQNDGNLVLYRETQNGAVPVWASDTYGQY
jgi:hypothetical protein